MLVCSVCHCVIEPVLDMDWVLTPCVLYKRVETTSFLNLIFFRSQMLENEECTFVFRRPVEGFSVAVNDEDKNMQRFESHVIYVLREAIQT